MGNVVNAICLKCPTLDRRKGRNQNPVNSVDPLYTTNQGNSVNPVNRNGVVSRDNAANQGISVNPVSRDNTAANRGNSGNPVNRNVAVSRDNTANQSNSVNPVSRDNATNRDNSVNPVSRDGAVSRENIATRSNSVNPVSRDNVASRDNPVSRDNTASRDNGASRGNSVNPVSRDNATSRDNAANRDNPVTRENTASRDNSVNRDNTADRDGSLSPVSLDSVDSSINRESFVSRDSAFHAVHRGNAVNSANKDSPTRSARSNQQPHVVSALLVVDVQYDFIDGTLALKNCPSGHQGEQVIPVINRLLTDVNFDVIVYTQDWHTHDHISFFENLNIRQHMLADDSPAPEELKVFDKVVFVIEDEMTSKKEHVEQILWPAHCIQKSRGAELHHDLHIVKSTPYKHVIHLLKGFDRDIDSYSAFWDNQKIRETVLDAKLREHNVTRVFIVGIATDVCVFATALHSAEKGYRTFIVEDACRGVDESAIETRLDELTKLYCSVIQAAQVQHLVNNPSVVNSPVILKDSSMIKTVQFP